jgi:hypothetical protein
MVMQMHQFLNRLFQHGKRLNLVNRRMNKVNNHFRSFCLDKKIFLLGIVQALFEASMYIFVLEWTPALTQALNKANIDKTDNKNPPIPHGLISK